MRRIVYFLTCATGVIAIFCGAGPALGQYVPGPYDIEEEFDREYGMDLVQLSYDRDWERIWRANDCGLRLAMGSLNVRQWHLNQEVKFAAEFTDWFRFLYRYDRYEGLEPLWDERQLNEMELEFRLWRWFKLGLRTQPTFWKRYADAGVTTKFHYGPGRYVEAGYTGVDFDNNYSFERSDYDEGYEEIFKISPRRYEARAAWSFPWGLAFDGEGFVRTPSTKYYTYFYGQQLDWARRYAERYGAVTVSQALPANVEVFYRAVTNEWEETKRLTGPPPAETPLEYDYDGRLTLGSHGLGAYYQPPGRHRLHAGVQRRNQTRRFNFGSRPNLDYLYEKTEIIYYVLWRLRVWRELYVETGYMGELVGDDKKHLTRGFSEEWAWAENRAPISLEYKFGENYAFKMSSGLDLDRRDWGDYLYYDKAYAFVIAGF
ncbi:MAG TPA: hypothetical protein VMW93_02090 [bacterium]|nr:hypothetical protein [bacterium]